MKLGQRMNVRTVEASDVLAGAGANIQARIGTPLGTGHTPMHYAAVDMRLEILTSFLAHGADVKSQTDKKETLLYCAACTAGSRGAFEKVDLLLRLGAIETIADADGVRAVEAVGSWIEEEDRPAEDVERVRELL